MPTSPVYCSHFTLGSPKSYFQQYGRFFGTECRKKLDGTRRAASTVMPPPAVTLIFDLLTPKSYQHVFEPKYICSQNWTNFPSLVFEIWCSQGFQDAQTHGRTDPKTVRLRHRRFSAAETQIHVSKLYNVRRRRQPFENWGGVVK